MPPELVARVEALLAAHPDLRGRPATDAEIDAAQRALGLVFDPQYVAFIKRFGGSFAGMEISAFESGPSTVVEVTERFRDCHGEESADGLWKALVISGDGAGNPVLISAEGEILLYLHDEGEVDVLFPSLYEMMNAWLP